MEVSLTHEHEQGSTLCKLTEELLKTQKAIRITSTDKQDRGKIYTILVSKITVIQDGYDDNDNLTLQVWWKEWIFDRYLDQSASFIEFILIPNDK